MESLLKILIILLLVFSQNCAPTYINNNKSTNNLKKELTTKINRVRANKGLPPLSENLILDQLAEEHCREMIKQDRPSHRGYLYRSRIVAQIINRNSYNENVAYAWVLENPLEQVVDVWLNSKSHSDNIYGDFDLTGIGIDIDDYGGVYITQIFVNE